MKIKLILLIFFVFFISFASATIDLTNGGKSAFKKGECITLPQTCDNCTFVYLSSITYPNSTSIIINDIMTKNGVKYNYTFCDNNILGGYSFSVLGDQDGINTTEEGLYEITYTGDTLNTQKSILYFVLTAILIFFFLLIIWFAGKLPSSETRDEEGQLIAISNLKYIGSVLIFVDWMILIAIFYITSNLAFAYLGEVLFAKTLFMIYTVCFRLTIPLIVLWFAWIFVQIFKDKKLKRMISKGIFPSGGKSNW